MSMEQILYSVIIPVYNSEDYLETTIESIIKQTYSNWELIIIDDGSTDSSGLIVKKTINENRERNIKYIRTENRGPSSARNHGLGIATGKYVCFLDSDDCYKEDLFEQLSNMQEEFDICYFGWVEVDNKDGTLLSRFSDKYVFINKGISGIEAAKMKFNKDFWICNCNAVYRRDFLIENKICYPEGVFSGEDTNFIYKALMVANKVVSLSEDAFINIYHRDSLMHSSYNEKHNTLLIALSDLVFFTKAHTEDIELQEMMECVQVEGIITIAKRIANATPWLKPGRFIRTCRNTLPMNVNIRDEEMISRIEANTIQIYNLSKFCFFYCCKIFYKIRGCKF